MNEAALWLARSASQSSTGRDPRTTSANRRVLVTTPH
jgi:hypothetical protein